MMSAGAAAMEVINPSDLCHRGEDTWFHLAAARTHPGQGLRSRFSSVNRRSDGAVIDGGLAITR